MKKRSLFKIPEYDNGVSFFHILLGLGLGFWLFWIWVLNPNPGIWVWTLAINTAVMVLISLVALIWNKIYKLLALNYFVFACLAGTLVWREYQYKKESERRAFRDLCNELRDKPECQEFETHFICGENKLEKNHCSNTTGFNDHIDFRDATSSYVGQTFTTPAPLLYQTHLPRNNCGPRQCGYLEETSIERLRNPCANCLDQARLTTKIRLRLLPEGTSLRVVKAFEFGQNSGFGSVHEMLVLEDQTGLRSEMSNLAFELYILKQEKEALNEEETSLLTDVSLIKSAGPLKKNLCVYYPGLNFNFQDQLLNAINQFFHDFKLESEVDVSENWITTNGKNETKGICGDIIFKTEEAYLTANYYFAEWDIYRLPQ